MNLPAYYDREATSGYRTPLRCVPEADSSETGAHDWLWACERYMALASDALCAAYNERRKR